MRIFTEEAVEDVRRHERLPEFQRPSYYYFVTSPHYQTMRDEIESWVGELVADGLTEDAFRKLRGDLTSRENWQQAYHELVIGSLLRRRGCQVEYSKPVCGMTPDWYVHPRGGGPALVVEVFTQNASKATAAVQAQTCELLGRLKLIQADFGLHVYFSPAADPSPPANKRTAREISDWLETDPAVGARMTLAGVDFEVLAKGCGWRSVEICAGGNAEYVDIERLRHNIEDKMGKYKCICRKSGVALVVAVVADPSSGISFRSFLNALLGREAVVIRYEKATGKTVAVEQKRASDGVAASADPVLSAVLWADGSPGAWGLTAIYNPNALYPLPPGALGPEPDRCG